MVQTGEGLFDRFLASILTTHRLMNHLLPEVRLAWALLVSGILGYVAAQLLLQGRVQLRQRSLWQKLSLVAAVTWCVDGIAWLPMSLCLVHMAVGDPVLSAAVLLSLLASSLLWLLCVFRMRDPALCAVLELTCEAAPDYVLL
jgi:hypothetical protein